MTVVILDLKHFLSEENKQTFIVKIDPLVTTYNNLLVPLKLKSSEEADKLLSQLENNHPGRFIILDVCDEKGCNQTQNLTACYYPDNNDENDEPNYYYCDRHAYGHGFCRGCGGFFGGIESFYDSICRPTKGLCEECAEEFIEVLDSVKESEKESDHV